MSAAVRSPRNKGTPGKNEMKSTTPYKLRDTAGKKPSRYRDEEVFISPWGKKGGNYAKRSPTKRMSDKNSLTANGAPPTKITTPFVEMDMQEQSSSTMQLMPKEEPRKAARRAIMVSPPREDHTEQFGEDLYHETVEGIAVKQEVEEDKEEWGRMQSFFDMFSSETEREAMIKKFSHYKTKTHRDVSRFMRGNLKKMNNILKYKKARQWIICEFFYSGIDDQIFNGDNEFATILKESFPNLKTWMLNKTEWRTIRRLLGKPRRCSALFFEEERLYLEEKRMRVRSVYEGSYLNDPNIDLKDLPAKLPKPLVVGNRVYARIRSPRDGIYHGIIDAVVPNGYRIIFEKKDDIPPTLVKDTEVFFDGQQELLSLAYFIEQANSRLPIGVKPFVSAVRDSSRPHLVKDELVSFTIGDRSGPLKGPNDVRLSAKNPEMVGNFPLKFLVNLVKLRKLIEFKKGLVKKLADMNSEAELHNMTSSDYPVEFKKKYSTLIIDLENVNLNIDENLNGIQEHHAFFSPCNELQKVKPEAVRKLCNQQAGRFVEHCNQGLNVDNSHALSLIQALTASLLHVRALGTQKVSASDILSLNESLQLVKKQISPSNLSYFQDVVEVHMKHFHTIMLDNGPLSVGNVAISRR